MTAYEKAIELVERFERLGLKPYKHEFLLTRVEARQCALIAVNEIIEEWQNVSDLHSIIVIDGNPINVIDKVYYHQQIKKEIEKL